jgi:hypothetical protein
MPNGLEGICDFIFVDDAHKTVIPVICAKGLKDARKRLMALSDTFEELTGDALFSAKYVKNLMEDARGVCITHEGLRWCDPESKKRRNNYKAAVIAIREQKFCTVEVVAHEVFHAIRALYPRIFWTLGTAKAYNIRRRAEEKLATAQGELTLRILSEAEKHYAK